MTLPDSHLPVIAIPTSFPLMRDDHCSGVKHVFVWAAGSVYAPHNGTSVLRTASPQTASTLTARIENRTIWFFTLRSMAGPRWACVCRPHLSNRGTTKRICICAEGTLKFDFLKTSTHHQITHVPSLRCRCCPVQEQAEMARVLFVPANMCIDNTPPLKNPTGHTASSLFFFRLALFAKLCMS